MRRPRATKPELLAAADSEASLPGLRSQMAPGSPGVTWRASAAPAQRERLHPGPAGLSLRAEVVTHLVKPVAPLVVISADTDYALAA
jgi:hypothetical protein